MSEHQWQKPDFWPEDWPEIQATLVQYVERVIEKGYVLDKEYLLSSPNWPCEARLESTDVLYQHNVREKVVSQTGAFLSQLPLEQYQKVMTFLTEHALYERRGHDHRVLEIGEEPDEDYQIFGYD